MYAVEASALKARLEDEAKARQREATARGNKTRHGKEPPVQEFFPELAEGQSRDRLGKQFGVNGNSVDHTLTRIFHLPARRRRAMMAADR
jgi:hypothetical protein